MSVDLPATLDAIDDVQRACEAIGLVDAGIEWTAEGVRVTPTLRGFPVTVYRHHGVLVGRQPIAELHRGASGRLLWHAVTDATEAER